MLGNLIRYLDSVIMSPVADGGNGFAGRSTRHH